MFVCVCVFFYDPHNFKISFPNSILKLRGNRALRKENAKSICEQNSKENTSIWTQEEKTGQ